jgi:hypothetical protein
MAFGCKRAGGFVDSGCCEPCDCDRTMRIEAPAAESTVEPEYVADIRATRDTALRDLATARRERDALALAVLTLTNERDEARARSAT